MGAQGHVFLTASADDRGIAQLNVLRPKGHRAQTRATDLVDAPGGAFLRQAQH